MSEGFVGEVQELVGERVEIYTSEQRETLKFSDTDIARTCVLRGKLLSAKGSCLVLELTHPKNKKKYKVCIQSWHINAIMKYEAGVSIGDFYIEDGLARHNR